jgi:hypothetical protein
MQDPETQSTLIASYTDWDVKIFVLVKGLSGNKREMSVVLPKKAVAREGKVLAEPWTEPSASNIFGPTIPTREFFPSHSSRGPHKGPDITASGFNRHTYGAVASASAWLTALAKPTFLLFASQITLGNRLARSSGR